VLHVWLHVWHTWPTGAGILAGVIFALYKQDFPWEGNWRSLHHVVLQGNSITYALTAAVPAERRFPMVKGFPPLTYYPEQTYQIHLWPLLFWVVLGAIVAMFIEAIRESKPPTAQNLPKKS